MNLQANGTELFYTVHGQGRPLLLMHGGMGPDHSYFRPWLDPLGDEIELIYYDHRSGGRSARVDSFEGITHDTLVTDADALRRHLGHERIVLLGHSYGGMLALEYALRYSAHLDGLILCCTAPAWDYDEEIDRNARARGSEEALAALERMHQGPIEDDALFAHLWATIQPLYFHKPDPAVISAMDANTRYSASAYDLSEVLLAGFDLTDELAQVDVHTLILAGRDDWVTPPSQAERMLSLIPQAEMVVFEKSGHYPFVEEQTHFIETVRRWVGRLVHA